MNQRQKSKTVQGYLNGVIFSLFYGTFDYDFKCEQQLNKKQVRILYMKSIGYKLLFFPPMLGLFAFTCAQMENYGYSQNIQTLTALGVGALYLSIIKFK